MPKVSTPIDIVSEGADGRAQVISSHRVVGRIDTLIVVVIAGEDDHQLDARRVVDD